MECGGDGGELCEGGNDRVSCVRVDDGGELCEGVRVGMTEVSCVRV